MELLLQLATTVQGGRTPHVLSSKVSNHNVLIHMELQAAKERRQPDFVFGLRSDQGN